jgi:signal recognition particle subunit SRP54
MRQGGGGMQEMMKAMMGGNVSDEEMAEMQSSCFAFLPWRS